MSLDIQNLCRIMRETLGNKLSEEQRQDVAHAIIDHGWKREASPAEALASVDVRTCFITVQGRKIGVQRAQAIIMDCLLRRRFADRDWLYNAVWGDADMSEKVLQVQISLLRKALKPFGLRIGCRWKVGYVLLAEGEVWSNRMDLKEAA